MTVAQRKRRFSRATLWVAVGMLFLNIAPIFVLVGAAFILIEPYTLELVVAGVLCLFGGRSRQVGVGILAGLGMTAVVIVLAILVLNAWG